MRRVAITGIGLITPLGLTVEDNWRALVAGQSGIGPITHFDAALFATKIAGEVRDLQPTEWLDKRGLRTWDPFVSYAILAAEQAWRDCGRAVCDGEAERVGVYIGAGIGGITTIERTWESMKAKGPRHGIGPYFVPSIIINMSSGLVSMKINAKGPNFSHVSACATGAHAIGEAARAIALGDADVMVAGGTEATVTQLSVGGFNAMRALSVRNGEPTRASRPFDRDRDGFVMGEGSGVVVLEELELAQRRGARIYAELSGYGRTADAHHISAPAPDGEGAQRCMKQALTSAKLNPEAIGYINAHGTSTKFNDETETIAIKKVLGDHARRVPISSTKSMMGHLLGAAGSVEAIVSALVIERGVLPPTINLENPDPLCDLDYVPNVARESTVDHVMTNSFGFGGTNATLVLSRVQGATS